MSLTNVQKVRLNIADSEPGLYILADDEISWFLEKNNDSVDRASIEAARCVLMKLSMRTDETVDILSIKGSKAAENYRQALMLYINNPALNPLNQGVQGWFGNVSKQEMLDNNSNLDNNFVKVPTKEYCSNTPSDGFTL